jgi:hypothetical protein
MRKLLPLFLIGIALAATPQVILHWLPSPSATAVSQTLSRSPFTTACGGYTKIASLAKDANVYADTTVVRGNSYCYKIFSVDANGTEGAASVISDVVVPK